MPYVIFRWNLSIDQFAVAISEPVALDGVLGTTGEVLKVLIPLIVSFPVVCTKLGKEFAILMVMILSELSFVPGDHDGADA